MVVTAAHCVDACDVCGDSNEGFYLCEPCEAHPRSTREIYVAAGFRTLDEVWQAEVVPVSDIFMHEAYRSFPDWNFDYSSCEVDDEGHLHCRGLALAAKPHDLAVLLLEAPVRGLAPGMPPSSGPWLFLILLLLLRGHRNASFALVFVAAVASTGCGSDGDANDVTFCTEKYDPLGVGCDVDVERLDLRTAEARARDEVPAEAWLWEITSGYGAGHLDPDGDSDRWYLTYYLPGGAELPEGAVIAVTVSPTEIDVWEPPNIDLACIPAHPITSLDSRRAVHDAIKHLGQAGVSVQIRDAGDLHLVQRHRCMYGSSILNIISYRDIEGYHYVSLDEDGEPVELRYSNAEN